MRVNYEINLGEVSIDSRDFGADALPVGARVTAGLGTVNAAEVALHPRGPAVSPDDDVEIALGGTPLHTVFRGRVDSVEDRIDRRIVHCVSRLTALSATRVNKLYEEQTAGDIVSDFAELADVTTARVEAGLTYPVYALADDRSMFDHVLGLATQNGFDAYADTDDALVFAPYAPSTTHLFQYGVDILASEAEEADPSADAVEVYGASPASLGQGADAYSWLAKGEVRGRAGGGSGPAAVRVLPVLKDVDSAEVAARAILTKASLRVTGTVRVLGRPELRLGDAVTLNDLPSTATNGTYKVTAMRHVLTKQDGFVTTLSWTEA